MGIDDMNQPYDHSQSQGAMRWDIDGALMVRSQPEPRRYTMAGFLGEERETLKMLCPVGWVIGRIGSRSPQT